MHPMTFKDSKVEMITLEGEVWMTSKDLGKALGYADERSIQRIYTRNKGEFTASMTGVVNLTTPSGNQNTRIFSLRGAHLLAMFARTPKAKAFRRWVLDLLDSLHKGGEYVMAQYQQASSEFEQGKNVASNCGKGLNHWKKIKAPLQLKKQHWQERQQLCLSLG